MSLFVYVYMSIVNTAKSLEHKWNDPILSLSCCTSHKQTSSCSLSVNPPPCLSFLHFPLPPLLSHIPHNMAHPTSSHMTHSDMPTIEAQNMPFLEYQTGPYFLLMNSLRTLPQEFLASFLVYSDGLLGSLSTLVEFYRQS